MYCVFVTKVKVNVVYRIVVCCKVLAKRTQVQSWKRVLEGKEKQRWVSRSYVLQRSGRRFIIMCFQRLVASGSNSRIAY